MKSKKLGVLTFILAFMLILTIGVVSAESGDSVNKFTGEVWNIIMMFLPFGVLMVVAYYLGQLIPFLNRFIPF